MISLLPMWQLPISNFDYKEFSPNCLIIEKVVTPVHFRSLRIWPMPNCSLINSPLSPWIFKPTIQLPIITPTYYSVLWYHSFYVILPEKSSPYPNLPNQAFIFFSKTQFRLTSSNKLPLTFSAKRINHSSLLPPGSEPTSINMWILPYYKSFVYKLSSPISLRKPGRVHLILTCIIVI